MISSGPRYDGVVSPTIVEIHQFAPRAVDALTLQGARSYAVDVADRLSGLDRSRVHVIVPVVPMDSALAGLEVMRPATDAFRLAWASAWCEITGSELRKRGVKPNARRVDRATVMRAKGKPAGSLALYISWDGQTLFAPELEIPQLARDLGARLKYHIPTSVKVSIPEQLTPNDLREDVNQLVVDLMRLNLPTTAVSACYDAGIVVEFARD